GYDVELVKYDLNAKGQGKDALGQVDIVVNHHGRRFHGVGLATDIVESSDQSDGARTEQYLARRRS
ncbi:2-isopropylmalate synthase, partial [Salmonella enterica subsp. enterica serovar Heidelberg str. 41573]